MKITNPRHICDICGADITADTKHNIEIQERFPLKPSVKVYNEVCTGCLNEINETIEDLRDASTHEGVGLLTQR